MRFAARLLSLILCFELIMGGYGPSLLMSSNVWAEEPCPAGTQKNQILNRCLTTNQVASIKMATARCNGGTKAEQQECYKSNAISALNAEIGKNGVEENNKSKLAGEKSPLLRVGSGAAIAVPLFLLTRKLFQKKDDRMMCKPASLMLMYAGAGVLLGGEVLTYIQHKKRLKDMKKNWEKIVTPTSGASTDSNRVQQTEAQSQAFEFLAQNEDSVAKTANTKFTFYAASAGLFAAGAVMAVVEKFKLAALDKAEKAAMIAGNVPAAATARAQKARIKCNVTRGDAKKEVCNEGGGKIVDKKCVPMTDEEKKQYAAKKEKEREDGMSKENSDAEKARKEAEKIKTETEKQKSVTEAKDKVSEAQKQVQTTEADAGKSQQKLAALQDGKGNPKVLPKTTEYIKAEEEYNEKITSFNSSRAALKTAQTNYDNILKPVSDTPANTSTTTNQPSTNQTTSSGTSQSPAKTKKPIDLAAVAMKGLGFLGGGKQKPGENKGNKNPASNEDLCGTVGGDWDESSKSCTCSDGMQFDQDTNQCISNDGSIETIRNYKLKKTAEYNLNQSRNAYELLELTRELENIEIENYSRITNFEEMDITPLKQLTFDDYTKSLITNLSLFGEAHALTCEEDSDCFNGAPCVGGSCGAAPDKTKVQGADDKKVSTLEVSKEIIDKVKPSSGIMKTMQEKVDKAIGEPLTRAALNGVFGTWIGVMSFEFKEQAKISKKRAEVLRNMKDEFATNSGITNCTDAERNSTAKPNCYCYTPASQRNTGRTNSAICQKLWGTFGTKGSSYLADSSKVCLDLNSNPDLTCSCRAKIGLDGKNSCLKAGASNFNISGLSTGSFKMLGSVLSPVSDLTNGVVAPAQFNDVAANTNAMRLRNAADDMLKKGDPNSALIAKKISNDIAASSLASTAGLSMGGDSSGSSMAMTPAEAVKALDEELEKGTKQEITTSGSSEAIGAGNAVPEKLEFGMTTEDLAVQEDQIAEVMNKDLDMDQADINKGSDTNLFDVLSNRYQRSGMRRLFDVNGKTEADKPAQSDINQ